MEQSDKPRLVRVTDQVEIDAMKAGSLGQNLAYPFGHYSRFEGAWYADAAELAKWRAAQKAAP